MKKALGLFSVCAATVLALSMGVTGCASSQSDNKADTSSSTVRVYTDDAGREIEVPAADTIESVYFTSSASQIYCFTIAPELAAGTATEFSPEELKYLPEGTADLEFLGTTSGGKELNPEAIIAADPDLIIDVTLGGITESDISNDDTLMEQTGIPVLTFDGAYEKIPELYTKLGDLLGKEDRAKELSDYCTKVMTDVENAVANLSDDQKVTVYYAEGPEGLATEPSSSSHALFLELSGAKNAAQDVEAKGGKGQSPVSLEQVLAWDPEVIIAWDDVTRGGADELIRTDANWANIQAVKDGRVYTMPNQPFSWCDRPPSANRILGVQWVANMLYPDLYDVDMLETTKEFYKLFYHVDISDEDALSLLGNSYTK